MSFCKIRLYWKVRGLSQYTRYLTRYNIIVHDYEKIEAEIVLGILQKNLNDFEGFKEARPLMN